MVTVARRDAPMGAASPIPVRPIPRADRSWRIHQEDGGQYRPSCRSRRPASRPAAAEIPSPPPAAAARDHRERQALRQGGSAGAQDFAIVARAGALAASRRPSSSLMIRPEFFGCDDVLHVDLALVLVRAQQVRRNRLPPTVSSRSGWPCRGCRRTCLGRGTAASDARSRRRKMRLWLQLAATSA